MKLTLRGAITALALAPAALLAEHPARADVRSRAPMQPLPQGLHLVSDGRYAQDVCDHSAGLHCLAQRLLPASFRPKDLPPLPTPGFGGPICQGGGNFGGGSPPEDAMSPGDVVAAYQIPAASRANGRVVALVDMPDAHAFDELDTYRQAFGIAPLPQCPGGLPDGQTPCFATVDEQGQPSDSSLDCPAADAETGLDMAMVSAACPDCSILLVQMTGAQQGPTPDDFVQSSATAAKLGAVATSISFGGPEQGGDPAGYTTPGHLVLAASGDQGYLLEGETFGGGQAPSYPASAPDVLAVGGTLLTKREAGAYAETVWNDRSGASSSGCSTEFEMPAFQTQFGALHFGQCAKRASADLAAAASFASDDHTVGIATYDAHDRWMPMVGTSAASPLVAAILTRVGLAEQVANDLGLLYRNMAAFHDVTSGDNDGKGLCPRGDVMCTAGPGWDGPTGLGTPDATKLAALALASDGPDAGADGGNGGDAGSPSEAGASAGDASTVAVDAAGVDASLGGGVGAGASSSGGAASSGDTSAWDPSDSSGGCTIASTPARAQSGGATAIAGALVFLAARRRRR